MLIDFLIEFPVANALKMTLDGVPTNERASFDQQRFADAVHTTQTARKYNQPFEKDDPLRLQFYSSYPKRRVRVVDCDGTEHLSLSPVIAKTFTGKFYRADCKFTSLEGKLFIYFDEGFEYEDSAFTEPGNFVSWLGRLPQVAISEGDVIRYNVQESGFEDSEVMEIRWNPALKVEGILTDKDSSLINAVDGVVEISYSEKDANLYQCDIDLSGLTEGIYYIKADFGISAYTKAFTSEPIDVRDLHKDTLAIDYSHEGLFGQADDWEYLYAAGWVNRIRIASNHHQITPSGQIQVYEDDFGVTRQTRAVPYRELIFRAFNIPSWVVDKLNVVFAHDTKKINDYLWEVQSFGEIAPIEKTDLGTFEVTCRQVDSRLSYRTTFQENLTAGFDPASFSDISYEGDTVQALFSSNTDSIFKFVALPSWITTDHEYGFQDGDTITFIIAANATFFDRTSTLRARAEDFPSLEAEIEFEQTHDTTQPQFIDASTHSVGLAGSSGSNQVVTINSSGDYDITVDGFAFTVEKEDGFTKIRITAPSQNNTPTPRTATVKLALQANPSVFVEISVSQAVFMGMVSISPGLLQVDASGGNVTVNSITVAGSTQWQMISSASWVIVDSIIRIGSVMDFDNIYVEGKPPYISPRTATVTFYNIANVADSVTLTIEQTD